MPSVRRSSSSITRDSAAPANNAPPAPAATTYVGDVRAVLMARCTACHSNTANAGFTAYPLSMGLADNTADYNETRMRVDLATPDGELDSAARQAKSLGRRQNGVLDDQARWAFDAHRRRDHAIGHRRTVDVESLGHVEAHDEVSANPLAKRPPPAV